MYNKSLDYVLRGLVEFINNIPNPFVVYGHAIAAFFCLFASSIYWKVWSTDYNTKPKYQRLWQMSQAVLYLMVGLAELYTSYLIHNIGQLPNWLPLSTTFILSNFGLSSLLYLKYYLQHRPIKFK